jgi:hypothetical protein
MDYIKIVQLLWPVMKWNQPCDRVFMFTLSHSCSHAQVRVHFLLCVSTQSQQNCHLIAMETMPSV